MLRLRSLSDGLAGFLVTTTARFSPKSDDSQSAALATVSMPPPELAAETATIANGGSLSDAVSIPAGQVVRGVVLPAAWTAAALSFDVSFNGGSTYHSLRHPDGTEFSMTVTAGMFAPMPTVVGATNIKLRSGLSGSTVNQGAERLITVLVG